MLGKPTPEEQLLRLIEGEKDSSASSKPPAGEIPSRNRKISSHHLSEKLQPLLRFFTPTALNIKLLNRILAVITLGLLAYLFLEITQTQAASKDDEIEKQLKGKPPTLKIANPPSPIDLFDFLKDVEVRNIFKPIKKEPTPPVIIPTPPTPPPVIQPPNPPVIMTDPMIEELKKKYKLVGVVSVAGKVNVIIERDKGEESYTIGINDTSIKGSLTFGGGEIKYSLKIKEIKDDTVMLIDEISNKEMELNLTP